MTITTHSNTGEEISVECTLSEIREYLIADTDGERGLRPDFVEAQPDKRLIRMAELGGDRFVKWLFRKGSYQERDAQKGS